jgi:hypothetical protein
LYFDLDVIQRCPTISPSAVSVIPEIRVAEGDMIIHFGQYRFYNLGTEMYTFSEQTFALTDHNNPVFQELFSPLLDNKIYITPDLDHNY